MPAVDVDFTAIPDMIEAQLTLSYSRLANLVRLIVDQGNGHDVDIDKMNSRIEELSRENAELRNLVESFMEDKSRESWVQEALNEMRGDVQRVSGVCEENSKNLASLTDQVQSRFDEVEKGMKAEAKVRANEVDQVHTSMEEMRGVVQSMGVTLKQFQNFVDVWEGKTEKTEGLTARDPAGGFRSSTEDRVEYLRSLPVFVNVFDEMDVLRQMLRQQAADSLSAKNAVGAIQRFSAVEAAASVDSDANKVDRANIENLQEAMDDVLKRLKGLEGSTHTPMLVGRTPMQSQQQQPATVSGEPEGMLQLERRLQEVENRIRGIALQGSDGSGVDTAYLTDLDTRLRVLEGRINDLPLQQLQQSEGGAPAPGMPGQQLFKSPLIPGRVGPAAVVRPWSASQTKDAAPAPTVGDVVSLPHLSSVPSNKTGPSNAQAVQGSGAEAPNSGNSAADQSGVEAGAQLRPSSPSQAAKQTQEAAQDDGLGRRVSRLEEGTAALEMKKADRRELAQLEYTLRQFLQNPALLQASSMSRGIMPRRPMSQQDSRGMSAVESAYYGNPAAAMMRSTPPGRPVFVGGTAHNLRDSSGAATTATVSSSHLV